MKAFVINGKYANGDNYFEKVGSIDDVCSILCNILNTGEFNDESISIETVFE